MKDAGLWWMVSFRHAGSDEGQPKLVIAPAAGTVSPFEAGASAEGTVAVYGVRLAAATLASGDPGYADGARLDPASPNYERGPRDRALSRRVASLLDLDVTLATKLLRAVLYSSAEIPTPTPIFDVLAGVPVDEVHRELNGELRFRTPVRGKTGGKPIARGAFYRVLRDPFYAGRIRTPEGVVDGAHEALVTVVEFERVQMLLVRRRRSPRCVQRSARPPMKDTLVEPDDGG